MEGEIETFSNQQKLGEFVSKRPTLQEMFKKNVLQREERRYRLDLKRGRELEKK